MGNFPVSIAFGLKHERHMLAPRTMRCSNGATKQQVYRVDGPTLAPGDHHLAVIFEYDGGGRGRGGAFVLKVDGNVAGTIKLPSTLAFLFADEGATIGRDVGTPLLSDYRLALRPFLLHGLHTSYAPDAIRASSAFPHTRSALRLQKQ